MDNEVEVFCFKLISTVGAARSCYVEAVQKAKEGDYETARKLFEEGNENFHQGHQLHAQTIQKEAGGDTVTMSLLVAHAEDQLMSAETLKIVCEELIELYNRTNK